MRIRVATCAVLSAVSLGTGCGQDDEDGYPSSVRANFMSECERESGGRTAACECALDEIEDKMTLEEFEEAEVDIAAGREPPAVFADAVSRCR